ncbi:restriction endonuclease subunit S [Paraclostridium sordellii]|uniref:restriction endonuclease subunit S n=1 Tax=Paraclostridium sordellii TaxID=1505 RepID=UPI0021BB04C8|nr:restriction endonuclease subunit S [Paeniclostridium sordellii]
MNDVATRYSGHTPNKKIKEYWEGTIPWISLKDTKRLDNRYIYETEDCTTEEGIKNSSAVLLPKDTVVLSRDATVGKIGIMGCEMATSQHFINYVCGKDLNNIYLYYDFFSKKGLFERIGIGSTIKTIGLDFFKKLNIIVPPLKEQEKIADILSTVDGQIDDTEMLIEKCQGLKKGLMQRLLTKGIGHTEFKKTEVGEIPVDWEVKKLEDVSYITMGQSPSSDSYNDKGIGVPFFQGNSEFGNIYPTVKKWCSEPKKIAEPLDILISVRAPVGAVNINNDRACIGRGLASIRQSNKINYMYLYYVLSISQDILNSSAQGAHLQL